MNEPATTSNDVVIEAWNTVLFDKFRCFKHLLTEGLAAHGLHALQRHPPRPGWKVLDIGCGFGDTTRHIANLVGSDGVAIGVDCADRFVQAAASEAGDTGATNASFFVADVQSDDLRGPYNLAFSRFGTMFFSMPGAAMRNIRRALEPGAMLMMVVWRLREDNPWLHAAELCVRDLVPVVEHEQTDAVHCGPGPFSMAGPDMVSELLSSAGFDQIGFERFDTRICIGRDIEEAVAFAMALGPAGEIIRLAAEQGESPRGDVAASLAKTLAEFAGDDGVWAPSSTWLVSARSPG